MATAVTMKTKRAGTTCARCGGLMVGEFCMDLANGTGELEFLASRCVQCGEVVDPLILKHRTIQRPSTSLTRESEGRAHSNVRSGHDKVVMCSKARMVLAFPTKEVSYVESNRSSSRISDCLCGRLGVDGSCRAADQGQGHGGDSKGGVHDGKQ